MELLGLLYQIVIRSFFLMLPLGVAFLAFRRLSLSQTSNAWLYAVAGLFAAFTAAGLLPWAMAISGASWPFFGFALATPIVWLGVVVLASPSRAADYEPLPETGGAAWPAFEIRHWLAPLVLENPEWPEAPRATFRHAPTEQAAWTPNDDTGADLPLREVLGRARRETVAARLAANDPALLADDGRGLLQVARDMRGNRDTERRRPRLLPPPRAAASDPVDDPVNLPFLPGTRHA